MLYLLMVIIYKEKYLESILSTLVEVGILNSNVIEARSFEEALPLSVPVFGGLKFTMEGEKPFSRLVLALVDTEEIIHEIDSILKESQIDISSQKICEIFTVPISNALGRKPYMEV
ncbi:MAG: hypothetical protein JW827_10670 [Spirochaetes bacterium]|nr:hypothetical protein [Spirochaetota bacterium]